MKCTPESLRISAELIQEGGAANELLGLWCNYLQMSRTKVIRLYGDPRTWPLPETTDA